MRVIDVKHLGTDRVIAAWEVDEVIVDPGPESGLETLLAARGTDEPPRALLLTHIHFDHAGASGSLVRRWPSLEVYVHERGAPHMADPSRLVASATRLYSEEGMKRLWGEVVPVPEANLRVLSGGETVLDGAFRVEYTPGHASHHVAYLHEASGHALVGDVAGVRIPPSDLVVAPTPPPDIDIAAWERSLDLVAAWEPSSLGLTHFGLVEDSRAQLEATREALHAQAALVGDHDMPGFVAAMQERVSAAAPGLVETYGQAVPWDHLYLGLDRWRAKFGG